MIGQTLKDRFDVTALIGKGAMGEVFRATDRESGATVAVKILGAHLAPDTEMVERFRREGEALRQLRHPNIVGFVDMFEHDGQQFIVMEYVSGGSLRGLLDRDGLLPIPRVRQMALDLCDALIRAHRLEIVHRDIKPENILIAEDGTPRITDFGVARLLGEHTRLTGSGTQMGTPYYMAPEAWEGQPLDAQADVWSLGVVLYEMLSGQVPFGGETVASVMNKVLTAPLPDLQALRTEVPEGMAHILLGMLTRDRADRYQSLREVAADLERGRPLAPTAKPRTVHRRPPPKPRAPRKRPAWLWGASGLLGLAVLAAAGVIFGPRLWGGVAGEAPPTPVGSFITEGTLGSTLFQDDFDDTPSTRWEFRPSTWTLETIDGRTALHNTPGDPSWASTTESSWQDHAIQFDFKFLKPDQYDQYYFMLRARMDECPPTIQAANNYVFFVSPDFVEAKKETCESGGQQTVQRDDRDFSPDEWHTAQILLVGNRVQMLIDGRSVVDFTDDESPMLSGDFSLDLENDVELAIDNFRVVEIIPGEAATATPVPVYATEGTWGSVLFEDDFEGGLSPQWSELGPEWRVESVDGQGVLHGGGDENGNFAMLFQDWGDFGAQTDFMFVKPDRDGTHHIQLFARGGGCPAGANWQASYTLDIFPYGAELQKGVCDRPGEWIPLAKAPVQLDPAQWHNIQFNLVGSRLTVILDGEQVIDYTDADSPMLSGRFALVTNDGTEALFDNVRVTEILTGLACAPGETELFADDFEDGFGDGWLYTDEQGAFTAVWPVEVWEGSHVLVGSGHNWATVGDEAWKDYTLRLRYKLRANRGGTGAAHLNIYNGAGRYYMNVPNGVLSKDPTNVELAQLDLPDDTEWHALSFGASASGITVMLDGVSVAYVSVPEPLPGSGIGLENLTGTVWYDDVLVCQAAAVPPAPTPPFAGGVLSLDGKTGFVEVPYDDSLALTEAVTIEAWVNLDSQAGEPCDEDKFGCDIAPIIAQSNAGSSIGNYMLAAYRDSLLFGFQPISSEDVLFASPAQLEPGWHHLAVVHTFGNGAKTALYLDGMPLPGEWRGWPGDASVDPDEAPFPNTGKSYMIGRTTGPDIYFGGSLDELRVWNVARTAEEIKATMYSQLAGNEAGLVGYWQFNEESPGSDSSPKGNDGTLLFGAEIQVP